MDQPRKKYKCPKCWKSYDVGTDLVEHLHDHNDSPDRHYQCKRCDSDEYLVYVHYQQPTKRIIGVYCTDCFKAIVPIDNDEIKESSKAKISGITDSTTPSPSTTVSNINFSAGNSLSDFDKEACGDIVVDELRLGETIIPGMYVGHRGVFNFSEEGKNKAREMKIGKVEEFVEDTMVKVKYLKQHGKIFKYDDTYGIVEVESCVVLRDPHTTVLNDDNHLELTFHPQIYDAVLLMAPI